MSEALPALFYEVFEALPRQGPGSRESTAKALALCGELASSPRVLDLGCGVGKQTFDLAELLHGSIVAVDRHRPALGRLRAVAHERGLENRIRAVNADMARPGLALESFDLVWSEGALYSVGLEVALPRCRELLRPGGWLAFTDAVWRDADPPAEAKAMFADYPTMGSAADVARTIESCGFSLTEHFTLPDEAWWDDFYGPMVARIEELRAEHAKDADALVLLDELAAEPALHREQGATYAYEFFVAKRPT